MTEQRKEVSGHVEVELSRSTIAEVVREDHLTNNNKTQYNADHSEATRTQTSSFFLPRFP